MLKIGGRQVSENLARSWIRAYLNGERGEYGYPAYDAFSTNDDPDRLCDGDLLAPVLLNVQIEIAAYADLVSCRPVIESALSELPIDVSLADADDSIVEHIGRLYAVLDGATRPRHVKGTKLAKILHRKRPALVPLYDEHVRRVYQAGVAAPIQSASDRTWQDFMTAVAREIRGDLDRGRDFWADACNLAPPDGPEVTPLRVLDIVSWRLGAS